MDKNHKHLELVAHVAAASRRDSNPENAVRFAVEVVAETIAQLARGDLEIAIDMARAKHSKE